MMVAMSDIQTVVDRIAEAYDPERVVLFGSYARGTATREAQADPPNYDAACFHAQQCVESNEGTPAGASDSVCLAGIFR